jgi:hypothetical protein
MIPSFKPGILSSNRIRAVASADVTPSAIDWTDNSDSLTEIATGNGAQTISGINTSINLYYQCIYCGDGGGIEYKKNAGAWISISELSTVSVSNGDTLDWRYVPSSFSGGETIIIEIRNSSDSDAIIDSGIQLQYSSPI